MEIVGAIDAQPSADFLFGLICLMVVYLVLWPAWIVYKRWRFESRISRSVVTSLYTIKENITPAELAYMFSTKITTRHMYATLLDMANRGVLILQKTPRGVEVDLGPKISKDLKSYEKLLVGQVHLAGKPVRASKVVDGFTNYALSSGEKVRGSREYVFWWLLRNTMRDDNRIHRYMVPRYTKLLLRYGVVLSLPVIIAPLLITRTVQAIASGDVDISSLMQTAMHAGLLWLMTLVPVVIISFFMLRFSGRTLGREWMLQDGFKPYLQQVDAYRAFVRLAYSGRLRFSSPELEEEAFAVTKPYAIALGYLSWDSITPGKS